MRHTEEAGRTWPEIRSYLAERGFQVKDYFTGKIYDACRIAEAITKKGARLIACVGGDGTGVGWGQISKLDKL